MSAPWDRSSAPLGDEGRYPWPVIPRTIADIGSVPDAIVGAAIVIVAAFIALKIVGKIAKLIVLVLIGIVIYVWVS